MKKKHSKKIIVAMSGGVDSSVSAYLLKQQGFNVQGVYIQVWSQKDTLTDCPWKEEIESASAASKAIGIPFKSVHLEKEYRQKVVKYLIDGYKQGITPNPDIMCNREVKFGVFLDWALKQGVNYIATGHYAQIKHKNQKYTLCKGVDSNKDQSYFLYTLTQKKLAKTLFPIGNLVKPDVRNIAKKAKLPNWDKKDSQGICFMGKVKLPSFLSQYIKPKTGEVVTVDGQKIGTHKGVFYYTIGQRHGLDLGSSTGSDAYYIAEKQVGKNRIVVAKGKDNPTLYSNKLICTDINWIQGVAPKSTINCKAKIRYRQIDQECKIEQVNKEQSQVLFKKAQFAIAPGQSIVFYQKDQCLGGGIISK